jgi:hypothetical protein
MQVTGSEFEIGAPIIAVVLALVGLVLILWMVAATLSVSLGCIVLEAWKCWLPVLKLPRPSCSRQSLQPCDDSFDPSSHARFRRVWANRKTQG